MHMNQQQHNEHDHDYNYTRTQHKPIYKLKLNFLSRPRPLISSNSLISPAPFCCRPGPCPQLSYLHIINITKLCGGQEWSLKGGRHLASGLPYVPSPALAPAPKTALVPDPLFALAPSPDLLPAAG